MVTLKRNLANFVRLCVKLARFLRRDVNKLLRDQIFVLRDIYFLVTIYTMKYHLDKDLLNGEMLLLIH